MKNLPRMLIINRKNIKYEKELFLKGYKIICGIDEVNVMSIAGVLLASAVIIDYSKPYIYNIADSKTISKEKRIKLAKIIRERSLDISIGIATIKEVDKLNIYWAAQLARQRAFMNLKIRPDFVLIDGKVKLKNISIPQNAIIDGDAKHFVISAASIIAKVTYDNWISKKSQEYPVYGWEHNTGCYTKQHLNAILKYGITKYHRKLNKDNTELC